MPTQYMILAGIKNITSWSSRYDAIGLAASLRRQDAGSTSAPAQWTKSICRYHSEGGGCKGDSAYKPGQKKKKVFKKPKKEKGKKKKKGIHIASYFNLKTHNLNPTSSNNDDYLLSAFNVAF